jgi:hypothetical protein
LLLLLLLFLLLLYDIGVSCHRPFLPGTSLESTVIPTAQASSFTIVVVVVIVVVNSQQFSWFSKSTGH